MSETATCEPPEEHRDVEWHWLRHEDGRLACFELYPHGMLAAWFLGSHSGTWLYARGWRYVGPAVPPQEGA